MEGNKFEVEFNENSGMVTIRYGFQSSIQYGPIIGKEDFKNAICDFIDEEVDM